MTFSTGLNPNRIAHQRAISDGMDRFCAERKNRMEPWEENATECEEWVTVNPEPRSLGTPNMVIGAAIALGGGAVLRVSTR